MSNEIKFENINEEELLELNGGFITNYVINPASWGKVLLNWIESLKS